MTPILGHVVFSTRNREAVLVKAVLEELHACIGGIVEHHRGTLLKAGSVADHVHRLIAHPRTSAPADLVQEVRPGSSRWLKTKGPRYAGFHWQGGYGMFSVSPSHRAALERSLNNQAEHLRKVTFQEAYRRLLCKYGVPFDERYVRD